MAAIIAQAKNLGPVPTNLAPSATITASSEHAGTLPAINVADGRITPAGAGMGEAGSWAVQGDRAKGKGEIRFAWKKPVQVAEVIYFGRCAWQLGEVFKDYEVWTDAGETPVVKGVFEKAAGPQRIRLALARCSKLTLRFLSSHGGSNPGAAEIMVFPEPLSEEQLRRVTRFAPHALISDHMVVQRGQPMRVLGSAVDGERVTIAFKDYTATATTENGRWTATLPAAEAGDAAEMTIQSAAGSFTVHDVLVGEVWIASGQSNMEMTVDVQRWPGNYDGVKNFKQEVAAANHPAIRMFYVPRLAKAGQARKRQVAGACAALKRSAAFRPWRTFLVES